jgi:hypothetical protein
MLQGESVFLSSAASMSLIDVNHLNCQKRKAEAFAASIFDENTLTVIFCYGK